MVGLESLEEQLSFLENMPLEQQLQLLDQALEEHHQVEDVHQQMVDSYLHGDLRQLAKQASDQLDSLSPESKDYFMEQGIDAREPADDRSPYYPTSGKTGFSWQSARCTCPESTD